MDNLKSQFLLNNDITYLNFGSFGACVKPVFEAYQSFQLELEKEPVQFITNKGLKYLEQSRNALAQYVCSDANDIVYVTNPSYAVNIIGKSLPLKKYDEVLTTNIEYGACDKTWQYYCQKAGAIYKQLEIDFPIKSKEDFVQNFIKGITEKTKIIFISHITSSTGLRLPVEEICAIAKQKGIFTFVDGAHAPGQIPLNLSTLQADIYTGACHKWMLTPKGSSFLYITKSIQNLFDPLVISWGYNSVNPSNSLFLDYHQQQGTRDFSAFLTIPTAIDFMKKNHWWQVAKEFQQLTQANANELCNILNTQPIAPINNQFICQLYSTQVKTSQPELLKNILYEKYKIEIPIMQQGSKIFIRYSLNAFNSQTDMDNLFNALNNIKQTTNLIE